jgi:hypothetical protein
MTVAAGRNNDNTKLTRVISTKLSIEFYNELQTITNRPTKIKESTNPPYLSFYDL